MYKIKAETVDMLKDGRTINYLCEIIGLTTVHLGNILKGIQPCKTLVAKALISIKENISIKDDKMEELLDYYFDKIK